MKGNNTTQECLAIAIIAAVKVAVVLSMISVTGCYATIGTSEAISRHYEGVNGSIELAKRTEGKDSDYMALRSIRYSNDTPLEKVKKLFGMESK